LDVVYPGATINDDAGNPLTNSFTSGQLYSIDKTPPEIVDLVKVTPDPRTSAVTNVDVVFTEPIVSTFTDGALTLTRDGDPVPLSSTVTVSFVSGATYRIGNLDRFTATPGAYVLTVNASDIQDLAGNAGVGSGSDVWSLTRPAVTISLSTNSVLLSWPNWAEGYMLEGATNLSAPVTWTPITNTPALNGDRKMILLNNTDTNRFFRLMKP
jgi:hypothetical protein